MQLLVVEFLTHIPHTLHPTLYHSCHLTICFARLSLYHHQQCLDCHGSFMLDGKLIAAEVDELIPEADGNGYVQRSLCAAHLDGAV